MATLANSTPQRSFATESAAAQRERGRLARQAIPVKDLGEFVPVDRDPVELVTSRNRGRLQDLVPLRHERMSVSPFTFYRGTAGLMAHDLAQQNQTDTQIVICGDAHISNFGLYASPERQLVFDLNDFDEAAPGPWEWDVRRLIVSAILAARENGESPQQQKKVAKRAAEAYQASLEQMLALPALERHYYLVDSTKLGQTVSEAGKKNFKRTTNKARKRDSDRAIGTLMGPDRMGFIRFKEQPPILTHVGERNEDEMQDIFDLYRSTTTPDINNLLTRFSLTDVARRVVGVGSVGTRCFVAALTAPEGHGLVLQVKEAEPSAVAHYNVPNVTTPETLPEGMPQGQRVITHQRILQSVSDPFLGHLEYQGRDYYVRQFRDAKGSFDTSVMGFEEFSDYVALCAYVLARAHAQSPMAHWIAGYIGDDREFVDAMTKWSLAYADQVENDYAQFMQAIEEGRIEASMSAQREPSLEVEPGPA